MGCAQAPVQSDLSLDGASSHISRDYFDGVDGCFLLYDLAANEYIKIINEPQCRKRQTACSTFKIPLAAMAFDAKVIESEDAVFKWDGKDKGLPHWNKDQTVASWIGDSVVWVSQAITPKLGMTRIKQYLKQFRYGNEDFSGGLQSAWLTPAPFMKKRPGNTLKISAFEQVEFMKKLWSGKLGISPQATAWTKQVLYAGISPYGSALSGKTGSGFFGSGDRKAPADGSQDLLRIGWYVAHVNVRADRIGKPRNLIAVAMFEDRAPLPEKNFGGIYAREILKKILADEGFW